MPRRSPQIQATNDHVTAPRQTVSKETKKVEDEVIVSSFDTAIENEVSFVVEPEPEVVEVVEPEPEVVAKAPRRASKAITTDLGTVETKEEPKPFVPHWTAPNGLILQADEPVRIEADDHGNYVVVKRDVYREVYPVNSKRPSYFLLYSKGSQVLKSTLQALN